MKKFILLFAALIISGACFAQRPSITDFCYYDSYCNTIETYSCEQIIAKLRAKGYYVSNTEIYYIDNDRERGCYYYYLYNSNSNTTVEISQYEGPSQITFNSMEDGIRFVNEATSMNYIKRSNGSKYIMTREQEYGVCGLSLNGKYIYFDNYVY
ncbi:MAG: hypothetical protein J6Q36_04535 [Alistipes sp.]|nr:hypothetical protein [Alistipes sp.]